MHFDLTQLSTVVAEVNVNAKDNACKITSTIVALG